MTVESDAYGFSLTLEKPVKLGGNEFSQITLREPLVEDLRILSRKGDQLQNTASLYSALSDGQVPPDVFMKLPVREMKKITKWFDPFVDGETS